jgi:hypothetical protein
MAGHIVASIGHYGFYGLSSSFDFIEAIGNIRGTDVNSEGEQEPLKILLVNPGDIRHILGTISRRRRHNKSTTNQPLRPIYFYLIESPIEVLARNILLLELINDYEVPIRQRASIFLEIFGNCKVQDRTARYIEQLGHQLRSLVSHNTGRLEDLIDLSLLRYRERDDLETTFKNYSRTVPFDIDSLRDHRLRGTIAMILWLEVRVSVRVGDDGRGLQEVTINNKFDLMVRVRLTVMVRIRVRPRVRV